MGQSTPTIVWRAPGNGSSLAGELVGLRLSGHGLLHTVLVIGGWVSQQHISNTLGVRNRCWRLGHLERFVGHVVGDDVVAAGHHEEWPGQHQQHQQWPG